LVDNDWVSAMIVGVELSYVNANTLMVGAYRVTASNGPCDSAGCGTTWAAGMVFATYFSGVANSYD